MRHRKTAPVHVNARELASILAALRYWQREGLDSDGYELDIATDGGELAALSRGEISSLCERINIEYAEAK